MKQITATISPTVSGIPKPDYNSCTLYHSLYHAHSSTDNSILDKVDMRVFEIKVLIYFDAMCWILLPDFNQNLAVLSTFSNMSSSKLTEHLFTGSQFIICRKMDGHRQGKVLYAFLEHVIVNALKQ